MGAAEREKAKQASRGFRCGKWGVGWGRAFGWAPAHARHSHLRASLSCARPFARWGSRAFPPKCCGRASRPELGGSEMLAEGRADAEGSVGVTHARPSSRPTCTGTERGRSLKFALQWPPCLFACEG